MQKKGSQCTLPADFPSADQREADGLKKNIAVQGSFK